MSEIAAPNEAIAGIENLIATLEILRDTICARDKEKGFEAVTVFLMQYMDVFGHDGGFMARTFSSLEDMKNLVQSEDYENAYIHVLAFLAKFRATREHLRSDI